MRNTANTAHHKPFHSQNMATKHTVKSRTSQHAVSFHSFNYMGQSATSGRVTALRRRFSYRFIFFLNHFISTLLQTWSQRTVCIKLQPILQQCKNSVGSGVKVFTVNDAHMRKLRDRLTECLCELLQKLPKAEVVLRRRWFICVNYFQCK